ncbi:MAG: AAA family ATPase [Verrucomicrobiales bacterium]
MARTTLPGYRDPKYPLCLGHLSAARTATGRFLLCLTPQTPDLDLLGKILALHAARPQAPDDPRLLQAAEIRQMQQAALAVPANDRLTGYIAALCHGTRKHEGLRGGLSPRAAIALLRAAQAVAWIEGHPWAHPDDVKRVALPVLQHRLATRDTPDASPTSARQWLEHLLRVVPVP